MLRSLDSLLFLLIKSRAEFVLNRTPKYFKTKKYKYLERRAVKGKRKSVQQLDLIRFNLIRFHFYYKAENDLYPVFT